MAKAKAKSSARKLNIKGATKADKQNIKLARAVNKAEAKGEDVSAVDEAMGVKKPEARDNFKNAAATPEQAPTPREARDAAEKLFQKANEQGKAEIIAENQLRNAAGL